MAKSSISVSDLIAQAKAKGIDVTGIPEPRVLAAKLSAKGAISVYGLGRWPVTLYKGQWLRLFEYLGFEASKANPAFRAVLAKGREKDSAEADEAAV